MTYVSPVIHVNMKDFRSIQLEINRKLNSYSFVSTITEERFDIISSLFVIKNLLILKKQNGFKTKDQQHASK